jgi:hypothetical protein
MSKNTIHIILALSVIIECIFLLKGEASSRWWGFAYFVNQSALIISLLLYLQEFLNVWLVRSIIALNIIKIAYNFLTLINENLSEMVNRSIYFSAVLILVFMFMILNKLQND